MRTTLIALFLILFASPVYADQHSNEPEDAPNEAETDEAEEDSKGNDFFAIIQKPVNQRTGRIGC